jgi:predicted HicB family RNase H-like nuclease
MKQYLEHSGYLGSIEASFEDKCLYGRIEFINDLVSYQGSTVEELEAAFKESVDDYLATCTANSKEPDRPFSGTFNIRVGPDLHKKAAVAAKLNDCSLNDFIKQAIEKYLAPIPQASDQHYHFHYTAEKINPATFAVGDSRWSQLVQKS